MIWFELSNNDKLIFFYICWFAPYNSTFYKKHQLDNVFPFLNLSNDITHFKQQMEIILLLDFKVWTSYKHCIINKYLNNIYSFWLIEDPILANKFSWTFKDQIENKFGQELIKLISFQELVISNDLLFWSKSNKFSYVVNKFIWNYDYDPIMLRKLDKNGELKTFKLKKRNPRFKMLDGFQLL